MTRTVSAPDLPNECNNLGECVTVMSSCHVSFWKSAVNLLLLSAPDGPVIKDIDQLCVCVPNKNSNLTMCCSDLIHCGVCSWTFCHWLFVFLNLGGQTGKCNQRACCVSLCLLSAGPTSWGLLHILQIDSVCTWILWFMCRTASPATPCSHCSVSTVLLVPLETKLEHLLTPNLGRSESFRCPTVSVDCTVVDPSS